MIIVSWFFQEMEFIKDNNKEGKHYYQQVVKGSKEMFTILHYVDTICKIGKDVDLSWSSLYKYFTLKE